MAGRSDRVPYVDGLIEGQGFNTYLQTGLKSDAVSVTRHDDSLNNSAAVEVVYTSELITEYDKLIESLEISAGAGVSKMGKGGSVDAKFLDRNEFERSFLTYLVKVDVRRQPGSSASYTLNWTSPPDPNEIYGDRFISDFVTGGALFARVSIISQDSSHHHDIEVAADVAFPVYGVDVKITESIKQSMEKIHQRSQVKIYLYYVGAPPVTRAELDSGQDDNSLIQLKSTADKFLADAKNHNWKRFAMLQRYTIVSNWKGQFKPFSYSEAKDRSWSVFDDFSECLSIQKMIRDINVQNYEDGREQRDKLDNTASDSLLVYRSWVLSVSANPEKSNTKPDVEYPQELRIRVLLAAKRTRYLCQSVSLKNRARTYFLDKVLHHNAKKHFEVEAYGFGDVAGTSNLLFGKKHGEEKYICLIGRSMTPGYEVMSQMWVFEGAVRKAFEQGVKVFALADIGAIELERHNDTRDIERPLFSFYARKA